MKSDNRDFDRLLRSAAGASEPATPEPPYGFETRVVALWRAGREGSDDTAELKRFLRRTGALALVVLILASGGAYQQFNYNKEQATLQTNGYAIADSAIQTEFSP